MNGRAETYNKFILKQLKLVVLNFPNRLFGLLSLFNEIIAYCVYMYIDIFMCIICVYYIELKDSLLLLF